MPKSPKALKKKLTQQEFYCVACRKRVKCHKDDIGVVEYKNKKAKGGKVPALRAYCRSKNCDCNLTKFIKRKDQDKFTSKFGKW